MDTICNSAFGMDLDILKNPDNQFFVTANNFFDNVAHYRAGVLIPRKILNARVLHIGSNLN